RRWAPKAETLPDLQSLTIKTPGQTSPRINKTLRLVSLVPGIAEAILRGTLPRTTSRQLLIENHAAAGLGKAGGVDCGFWVKADEQTLRAAVIELRVGRVYPF
ncbi:MAG: hypothetical protein NTX56_16805, partial [Proteobacteria bacterium]|nr:hypothetical protein [Pseudomonadota bacterium]